MDRKCIGVWLKAVFDVLPDAGGFIDAIDAGGAATRESTLPSAGTPQSCAERR
jgi:hypothetical protein